MAIKYICDTCEKEAKAVQEPYPPYYPNLPEGWQHTVRRNGESKHFCDKCSKPEK